MYRADGRRRDQGGGVRAEEQAEGGNDPKWRSVGRQVRTRGGVRAEEQAEGATTLIGGL